MLKGVDPLLTPELLLHLSRMGHGEWVAVVDANFTAHLLAQGKPVVQLPGIDLLRASQAVLSVTPLAADVEEPVAYMRVCNQPVSHRTPAQQSLVQWITQQEGLEETRIAPVERYAFYDKVKQASLIVQTGDLTAYANALFCKAVILPQPGEYPKRKVS